MDYMDGRPVQLFLVYAILHDDFETKPVNRNEKEKETKRNKKR